MIILIYQEKYYGKRGNRGKGGGEIFFELGGGWGEYITYPCRKCTIINYDTLFKSIIYKRTESISIMVSCYYEPKIILIKKCNPIPATVPGASK